MRNQIYLSICLIFLIGSIIAIGLISKYMIVDYYAHQLNGRCEILSCNETKSLNYGIEYTYILNIQLRYKNELYNAILNVSFYNNPGPFSFNNTLLIDKYITCYYDNRDIKNSLSLEPLQNSPDVGIGLLFLFGAIAFISFLGCIIMTILLITHQELTIKEIFCRLFCCE